jgi:hypothetical protein
MFKIAKQKLACSFLEQAKQQKINIIDNFADFQGTSSMHQLTFSFINNLNCLAYAE